MPIKTDVVEVGDYLSWIDSLGILSILTTSVAKKNNN
jgi:hypothetical protein